MISKVRDGEAARRRRFSIAAALLIVGILALVMPRWMTPETQDARESSPEVVTIERKSSVPRPAPPAVSHRVVAHAAPAPAVPAAEPKPVPHVARVLPAATAPPVPKAPRRAAAPVVAKEVPVPAPVRMAKHATKPAPKAIALAPEHSAVTQSGAAAASAGKYSAAQMARIQNDLDSAVASAPKANPLAVPSSAAVASTMKDYGPAIGAFNSIGDSRNHHGLCDPIRDWSADGYDYYYVACNVRFSDGTMQRQSVPWPIRFTPGDDPFNGTSGRDMALAMPLPDWHEQPGAYISPELREYAKDHGVTL